MLPAFAAAVVASCSGVPGPAGYGDAIGGDSDLRVPMFVFLGDSITFSANTLGGCRETGGMSATKTRLDWAHTVARDAGADAYVMSADPSNPCYYSFALCAFHMDTVEALRPTHVFVEVTEHLMANNPYLKTEQEVRDWFGLVGNWAAANGARLIVLSYYSPNLPPYSPGSHLDRAETLAIELTTMHGGTWVDLTPEVNGPQSSGVDPCSDPPLAGIEAHPSDVGHAMIAAAVTAAID